MEQNENFTGRFLRYPDTTGKRQAEGGRRLKGIKRSATADLPLVTIITVCWNSAKTIEQTFRSVQNQTYSNIEYVVVDGGSIDGTVDLLQAYENLIDYFVSEPDEGLYHAMNKGIELAQGDYIIILNSDDWYVDDAVETLVKAIEQSGCDFVSGLERYVNGQEKLMNISPIMHFDYSLYLRAPIHHETMLVPRRIYDQIGPYNTKYRIVGDLDLMLRMFEAGITHYKLHKQITFFRQTGISNTDKVSMLKDRTSLLEEKFPFLTRSEIEFLADRSGWTGFDLLDLASRNIEKTSLVAAIQEYILDHGERARQGRGLHAGWQPYADQLLQNVKDSRSSRAPLVSIILAVHNAEATIRHSIESALRQSLYDIELICINDQSPDGCQAIINEYVQRDHRVVSVVNEANMGLGATRNRGVAIARGAYVFHLDPDDSLPPHAMRQIYDLAERYKSDMTRGAYTHEQYLMGEAKLHKQRRGLAKGAPHIVNSNIEKMPQLLNNTEGHWSYLYRTEFARRVKYPEDLKMGQDSIFLVDAITQARSISVTDVLVYQYRANINSAMNTFNFEKFMDALEWRIRAWKSLSEAGHKTIGEHLLIHYWNPEFFRHLANILTAEEKAIFDAKLGRALVEAEFAKHNQSRDPEISGYFNAALPLRVATLCSFDHGGAGRGSQRRVEALREWGVDAHLHCVLRTTEKAHVSLLPVKDTMRHKADIKALRRVWSNAVVLTEREEPGLKASEMFSKPNSIVDFRHITPVFDKADIVHMHWVSGIFDLDHTDTLADKPVVWTLADMNAFTGGCHYSEGCEGYKDQCRGCPLLGGKSDLAHEAWKKKRAAYAKIKNLQVICPSQWLADRAQASSLLGDRPVHVIPNALPVDRFNPTNKLVARQTLGLPLDQKLVVFGADNLDNRRKGGDILQAAIAHLKDTGQAKSVEGVFFGAARLDLGVPSHNMGHVSDEVKLSLIYAAADVFAFPSREDNAPLTVAESLLSGTPVVGFSVGNVPELLRHRDTGYIADYEDVGDFAQGLVWALSDCRSDAALMRGLQGCLDTRAHNDPKTAAARHIALYQRMLGQTVTRDNEPEVLHI